MKNIRFFHEINGDVQELPDGGTFSYERGLQEFLEKYLRTLTGVEFLASEYSTGQRLGRRRVDLLRYRRYGEAYVALEHGGDPVEPPAGKAVSPRPPVDKQEREASVVPYPESTDYSLYQPWTKACEETRARFLQLKTYVESLGPVQTRASKTVMSGRPRERS